MEKILEDNPLEDNPIDTDTTPIKDNRYHSSTPFIGVDPVTGQKKGVATAEQDIANREALAKKSGVSPDRIPAPAPQSITPQEKQRREKLVKGVTK